MLTILCGNAGEATTRRVICERALPEEARGKRGKLRDLQKVPHSYSTAAPFVRPAQRAPHDPNIALAAVRPCQMKHQDVQGLEGEGLHREQIRGPEVVGMVGQQRAPGPARRVGRAVPSIALDRRLGDHETKLQQFAANVFAAPARIVPRHGGDQLTHLGAEPWPSQRPA